MKQTIIQTEKLGNTETSASPTQQWHLPWHKLPNKNSDTLSQPDSHRLLKLTDKPSTNSATTKLLSKIHEQWNEVYPCYNWELCLGIATEITSNISSTTFNHISW